MHARITSRPETATSSDLTQTFEAFDCFSAISAYLCVLCVKDFSRLTLTQRTQRYAEIAEEIPAAFSPTYERRVDHDQDPSRFICFSPVSDRHSSRAGPTAKYDRSFGANARH